MIIASAVKTKDGQVFVGKRHTDAWLACYKILDISHESRIIVDDGFVTSDLKFLDRKEAFIYAKEHGQFRREEIGRLAKNNHPTILEELFSEDLW